jgi:hypothetical protein
MSFQTSNFDLVCDFNKTFDFPVYPIKTNPLYTETKSCNYRCDLIKEEGIEEFGKAFLENNHIEMLDAVCDHLYVLYGACYTFGINPDHYIKVKYHNKINYDVNITELIKENCEKNITIQSLFESNCELESMLRHSMLLNKNIFEVYPILMCLIINTYNIGFQLTENLDYAFRNVHESNMSKLCKTIEEAEQTVKDYERKYNINESPYDSPYYYELKPNLYVIKNKSTGKALKSINYTPANLKQFLKCN